jgi:hypothetical protein
MSDTAFNPETREAVRLENNKWVPTDAAFNDKGEVAIWDGSKWVVRKITPETPVSEDTPATPEASEDQELRTEDPFKSEMEALSRIADRAKTSDNMAMIANAQTELGKSWATGGKIFAKVGEQFLTFFPETFLNITKVLAPETAERIEQSETGQAVSTFINNLNPTTENEELAATLVSYLGLVTAGRQVSKDTLELLVNRFGAPKAKKIAIEMNKQMGGKARDFQSRRQRVLIGTGTATGTAATSIAADVALRPEDLILSAELVDNFPETFDYIAREIPFGDGFVKLANELRIAETDSERTKVLKQYGDAALLELPLNAVVQSIFTVAKYGPKATMEAAKTGAKTKLGKRIASGLRPVTETVANINTRTGRILTSRAALPRIGDDDEMMQAALSLQNSRKYFETQVTFRLKELQRAQKRYGVSDDVFKSYFNTGKGDINPNVKELVDDFKVLINQNEAEIAKILGYKDGNFGVRSDGQDFYVTRQYSSALSPKDNKRMKEAILAYENKKTISDASLENRINGVIKLIDPEDELSRSQRANVMYNIIENMRGTEGSWHRSLFDGVSDRHARSVAEANAKSLLARKDLPEEFRAFLGQVDDPYKGIQSTVLAQGQVLSQLRYYKDIQRIASQTKGKEFELPGLVPFLPSRKETFKEGAGAGDKYLSELMRDAMGKFGGVNNKRILEDPAVSEYFARMISRGLDVYDVNNSSGLMRGLSKISSFGQALQTTLDAPAYLLNTSGMLQMMVANGHGFNPKNYVRAISEINTLAQQVIKKDARAIETLATLKRLGVIDQDVTGEMIAQNARIFGDKQGNIASRAFSKTMEKAGRLYGQPDLYGKLVAFQSEVAAQRAMFPNLSAKQINERAATIVRDTMPTYGSAPAFFRQFSRIPVVGNYTLFPVELVRTTKNVAKYGVRDLQEGLRTGNMRQAATGLRRLAGLSAVAVGMDQLFTQSRNVYGITDEHRKVMATLRPEWSAGSDDVYMEPVHIDELGAEAITPETVKSQFPEDNWPDIKERLGYKGNYKQFIAQRVKEQKENYKPFIKTRTLNSAAFNTFDQIVRPIKLLTGRIFGGETLSEEELEDPLGKALNVALGQFVSPKIAVQAGMNVLTGVDNRTGKPVYENYAGITTEEKISNGLETLLKPITAGGSYKIIDEFAKTQTAEELLGLGRAERANGRPLNENDLIFWGATGSRPRTRNLTLEMGYNLYQDMLPLTASKQRLQNEIRQLEPQLLTEEKMNEFAELYRDSQERSRQAMRKLSRKVENFASMPVQVIRRRNEKKVVDQERVGIPRVLEAATRSFTANANPRLIESLQASLNELNKTVNNQKDRFDIAYVPDNLLTESFVQELRRKRFTVEQINMLGTKLGNIMKEQASRPLYQDPPEEAK